MSEERRRDQKRGGGRRNELLSEQFRETFDLVEGTRDELSGVQLSFYRETRCIVGPSGL